MRTLPKGYSLIEVIIYTALVVVVGGVTTALTLQMVLSVGRARASSMAIDGARQALDMMTRDISQADLVYTGSTSSNQLSIRTTNGLSDDDVLPYVYVDYFVNNGILYRHTQGQTVAVSSDSVTVSDLSPVILYDGEAVSVSLSSTYNTGRDDLREQSEVTLHSTVTTRSYANN